MSAPSHYQRLGVRPDASAERLRQAFRLLSKRYHPDTTALPQPEAEAAFRELQGAYSVLSDPDQRRRYDAELALITPASAPAAPRSVVLPPQLQQQRRPLSGGEWLALLLLVSAVLFSLLLGVGLAWMRGVDLVQWPSWWLEAR
jgi:curved DNA-binding protein CbpA